CIIDEQSRAAEDPFQGQSNCVPYLRGATEPDHKRARLFRSCTSPKATTTRVGVSKTETIPSIMPNWSEAHSTAGSAPSSQGKRVNASQRVSNADSEVNTTRG